MSVVPNAARPGCFFLILFMCSMLAKRAISRLGYTSILNSNKRPLFHASRLYCAAQATAAEIPPVVISSTSMDTSTKRYKEIVFSGNEALDRLFANANFRTPPSKSPEVFVEWARATAKRKYITDGEFRERTKVRELRRKYAHEIKSLEKAVYQAKLAYESNPNNVLIAELERMISNSEQAVASMERFLSVAAAGAPATTQTVEVVDNSEKLLIEMKPNNEEAQENDEALDNISSSFNDGGKTIVVDPVSTAATDITSSSTSGSIMVTTDSIVSSSKDPQKIAIKRAHVADILPAKKRELEENLLRRKILRENTPELMAYEAVVRQVYELYDRVGLTEAVKQVGAIQKGAGRGRNSRGRSFENTADSVLLENLIPQLALKHQVSPEELLIVRNIKLGMASSKGSTAELDSLVCIRSERPERLAGSKPKGGAFCKVLAVVEVKRNPDDVGEAFVGYQRSLAWLSGLQHLYDPSIWRTKAYPSGHFNDRPFLFDWNGETLMFTAESFAGLGRRRVVLRHSSDELKPFALDDDGNHGGGSRELLNSVNKSSSSTSTTISSSGRSVEGQGGDVYEDKGILASKIENIDNVPGTSSGDDTTTVRSTDENLDIAGNRISISSCSSLPSSSQSPSSPLDYNAPGSSTNTNIISSSSSSIGRSNEEVRDPPHDGVVSVSVPYELFVDQLYFVTKDGTLDNIHSKAMCWAVNKISVEEEFDMQLSDEISIERLRRRLLEKHPHRLATLDLIQLYRSAGCTEQLFVVGDDRGSSRDPDEEA